MQMAVNMSHDQFNNLSISACLRLFSVGKLIKLEPTKSAFVLLSKGNQACCAYVSTWEIFISSPLICVHIPSEENNEFRL